MGNMTTAIALLFRNLFPKKAAPQLHAESAGIVDEFELILLDSIDGAVSDGEILRRGTFDECMDHSQGNYTLKKLQHLLVLKRTGKRILVNW